MVQKLIDLLSQQAWLATIQEKEGPKWGESGRKARKLEERKKVKRVELTIVSSCFCIVNALVALLKDPIHNKSYIQSLSGALKYKSPYCWAGKSLCVSECVALRGPFAGGNGMETFYGFVCFETTKYFMGVSRYNLAAGRVILQTAVVPQKQRDHANSAWHSRPNLFTKTVWYFTLRICVAFKQSKSYKISSQRGAANRF